MSLRFLFICLFLVLCVVFFFFKQKTADEMRISDWSSDVCSSDLGGHFVHSSSPRHASKAGQFPARSPRLRGVTHQVASAASIAASISAIRNGWPERSEEHTSELQSLMRSSYAVFCLKKKTQTESQQNNQANTNKI